MCSGDRRRGRVRAIVEQSATLYHIHPSRSPAQALPTPASLPLLLEPMKRGDGRETHLSSWLLLR